MGVPGHTDRSTALSPEEARRWRRVGMLAALDWLATPLRRLGLGTEGFMLALRTALEFVPLLASAARQRAEELRGTVGVRELWRDVLPRVIADLYANDSD